MIVYTLDCKEILFKIMIEKISYLQPYEENVEGEILKKSVCLMNFFCLS